MAFRSIFLCVALLGTGFAAQAATFNVNSMADEPDLNPDGVCQTAQGECTLRAAIQESNSEAGPDTINLPAGLYLLDRDGIDDVALVGDLDVTDTAEVVGAGPDQTDIEATQRAFQVRGGGDLTLRDLTLRGVDELADFVQSGCLDVFAEDASALADNVRFERVDGQTGAFCISVSAGSFVAENSTFNLTGGFTAKLSTSGLGPASVTIRDSVVNQQTGAREFMRTSPLNLDVNQDLDVTIERTTFAGLTPAATGGSTLSFVCKDGTQRRLSITGSSFEALLGPGPNPRTVITVLNRPSNFDCDVLIRESEFVDNDRALDIRGQDGAISAITAIVEDSTFSGNYTAITVGPPGSQQFDPRDRLTLRNVTISDNADFGVRTFNNAFAFIYNSTFAGNGTALSNEGINDFFLDNTILADSTVSDCEGDFIGSFNLIENGNCTQVNGQVGTIITGVDPVLGALADNGGPVATHALLAGSPAIDAGNPNVPFAESFGQACEPFDARGVIRPQDNSDDGSLICDMGTFEAEGTAPAFDHGDAPAPYPTLAADNGARHLLADGRPALGLIDSEADGLPSESADGDDLTGVDDEDGVDLPASLSAGSTVQIDVTVDCDPKTCGGSGLLSAWIDLNLDGDWDDDGEQVLSGSSVPDGVSAVTLGIPFDAAEGESMARFRIGDDPISDATGSVLGGEVEDYAVALTRSADANGDQVLISSRPSSDADFGRAVAVLGDDLLIGEPDSDRGGVVGAGSVQVFERVPKVGWRGAGELTLPDPDPNEPENQLGIALDIANGDKGLWAAVGAERGSNPAQANAGAVYLYRKESGAWVFQQKLNAPVTSQGGQAYGSAVGLDFDSALGVYTLAVGARLQEDGDGPALGGAVYLYQLGPFSQFTLIDSDCAGPTTPCGGILFPPESEVIGVGDDFGTDLGLDDDRLIIGAPYMDDGSDSRPGRVFVFERAEVQGDGSYNWVHRATLADPGPAADAEFGYGVGAADDALVVIAPGVSSGEEQRGRGYLFDRDALSGAAPIDTFSSSDASTRGGSNFGDRALGVDGNVIAVGSSSAACDRVSLHQINGQAADLLDIIEAPPSASSGSFGEGLDVDSATRTVVIGAPNVDIQGEVNAGAAYVAIGLGRLFADSFEATSAVSPVRGGGCE
jgi:CSLREA domain-containing protein